MGRNIPNPGEAEHLLKEAEQRNPGLWAAHSRNVALAAKNIAECCPGLDSERAYVFGLLHDIGRRGGSTAMNHTLDGYRYCLSLGYPDCARICITHSFPDGDVRSAQGEWETDGYRQRVEEILAATRYDDYDRLIQLCDALGDASGFCLIEKRLVDVAVRRGIDQYTLGKWKSYDLIRHHFESLMKRSIYSVLPGVAENTFRMRNV